MDYLRREIDNSERLYRRKKTALVPSSATSPVTAGRRLLLRTSTAGIADWPVAVTPSSSPNREGDSIAPRTDAPGRLSERLNAAARLLERCGSNRDRESDEPLRGRERLGPHSYEHRGGKVGESHRSARRTKPGDEPSSGDHSEGSSGEPVVERKLPKQNGRQSNGVKLGSYDGSTCLQTFLERFENYSEYFEWDEVDKLFQLRTSLVGAAVQILWDTGKQSTVGRIVALLTARFGSEN